MHLPPQPLPSAMQRLRGLSHKAAWVMAGACGSAMALTLGPVSVESGIGQPLRAAIEITQYKVEDLRQLKLQLASESSFEQAQMAFHPALNGLQTRLEFRGDGKPFIALTGLTPVNEHFIDVIVEAKWPSGRLAMNYTLLVSPVGAAGKPAPQRAELGVIDPVISPPALASATNPVVVATPLRATDPLTVRAGDTASRLVLRQMPAGVTLDQMLLAMVRSNPEAFIEGNVNLLREGAQVLLPSAEEASQISAEEARQTVVAQTVDFVAYARRLAQSAPKAPANATREMSGTVSSPGATPPPQWPAQDTLTLTKRSLGIDSDEARLAVEREIQDKTEQLAALKKNLDTLKSISAATPPASAQANPAARVPPPSPAPTLPTAVASTPTPSLLDQVSRSPWIWTWVMALLGGMAAWVWLARRRPANGHDLFAQHPPCSTHTEPNPSKTSSTPEDPVLVRAPLPSGLPPQFAHLDLNLTPAADPGAAPESTPLTGAKT